jgi:hypothetical protein
MKIVIYIYIYIYNAILSMHCKFSYTLKSKPFRLDLNWISKTGLNQIKIACQHIAAMPGSSRMTTYVRTDKRPSRQVQSSNMSGLTNSVNSYKEPETFSI